MQAAQGREFRRVYTHPARRPCHGSPLSVLVCCGFLCKLHGTAAFTRHEFLPAGDTRGASSAPTAVQDWQGCRDLEVSANLRVIADAEAFVAIQSSVGHLAWQ
jgi:hypothetical protein